MNKLRVIRKYLFELSAEDVGKTIVADVFVIGESAKKALPKRLFINCDKCGTGYFFNVSEEVELTKRLIFSEKTPEMPWLFNEKHKECDYKEGHSLTYKLLAKKMIDFREIYIRDLPFELEKFEERALQSTRAYVVGRKIPSTRRVRIEGVVTTDPKKRDIIIIIQDIQPLKEGWQNFKITEEDKQNFNKYFRGKDPHTLVPQIAPNIVGEAKKQHKLAVLLVLHSPCRIRDVRGNIIRGTLKIVVIGDTKTAKTVTVLYCTNHYGLGEYVAGESASRTGLTYAIDPDKKVILWGALPLNDGGLVAIDGLQDLPQFEWDKLTEVLETERVNVHRSVRGEAPARTRIIANMNPKRRHPMSSYAYVCQAICDNWIFDKEKNVTRMDLFIPTFHEDVPYDEIAEAIKQEKPIPDDVFIRHVYWVWSRKPEQIIWTDDAKEVLIKCTKGFMRVYQLTELPIVHNGYRKVLCRIAVAWAALVHSTDETHEKIIARKEHVEEALRYVFEVLKRLQLHKYKKVIDKTKNLEPFESEILIGTLDETDVMIIRILSSGTYTAKQIAEKLGKSEASIWSHFKILKSLGLVEAKTRVGAKLTIKGSKVWKQIRSFEGVADEKKK